MDHDQRLGDHATPPADPSVPLDGMESLRALFGDRPDLMTAVAGEDAVDQRDRARSMGARRRIGRVWGALHRR